MKKVLLLLALLLVIVLPANSISFRIALSDFAVHSKNPNYEFMGKGISEMIAVELAKATGVNLIEREKRAEVLEEIEFALSDLADTTKQVEVGRMLAAKYLVFGEIIDMDGEVLISLRMVDVESAIVVWNKQIVARITNYDYITGYFTMSILEHLGLPVPSSTIAKVESIEEKNEDAVVAFSKAVDAYDRKETAEATKELARARRIDPDNEAVRVYLSKLLVNLSKFKVEAAAMQLPRQNPAYLGILQYAQVSVLWNWTNLLGFETILSSFGSEADYHSTYSHFFLGYIFPVGQKLGFQTSLFNWAPVSERFNKYTAVKNTNWIDVESWGTQLGFGWAVTNWLSVGIGASLFVEFVSWATPFSEANREPSVKSAFAFGLLFKNVDSTVTFDVFSGFSLGGQYLLRAEELIDYIGGGPTYNMGDSLLLPLLLEGTLTVALLERRIFLVLRQRNDIFIDQASYTGRVTPGAEIWVTDWFSFRGGVELSIHKMETEYAYGIGGVGGIALRSVRRGWDFELGGSYRLEPIRSIPGETIYEPAYYINIAKNLLSQSR
jgi:TolB-like protein